MPNIGISYSRTKPRIQIPRNFDFQNPANSRIRSERVKDGVVIKSGQVISLEWNNADQVHEWVLGWGGSSIGRPYLAWNDSSDPDVVDAGIGLGKLTGVDLEGHYIVETAFYKTGETYNEGVLLTYDGVTGDVKPTTLESGEPILGVIEGIRGVKNVHSTNATAPKATSNVVRFSTKYLPNTADAT